MQLKGFSGHSMIAACGTARSVRFRHGKLLISGLTLEQAQEVLASLERPRSGKLQEALASHERLRSGEPRSGASAPPEEGLTARTKPQVDDDDMRELAKSNQAPAPKKPKDDKPRSEDKPRREDDKPKRARDDEERPRRDKERDEDKPKRARDDDEDKPKRDKPREDDEAPKAAASKTNGLSDDDKKLVKRLNADDMLHARDLVKELRKREWEDPDIIKWLCANKPHFPLFDPVDDTQALKGRLERAIFVLDGKI